MNQITEDKVYTITEVSTLLRVDRRTVLEYIKAGKIKVIRLGKTYRIPVTEINYLFPKEKDNV